MDVKKTPPGKCSRLRFADDVDLLEKSSERLQVTGDTKRVTRRK